MIENERQYDITRKWAGKFREALEVVRGKRAIVEDPNELWKLRVYEDAFRSQLADLDADIAEYERVQATANDGAQPDEEPYPLTEIGRIAVDMGVTDLSTRHDWYARGRAAEDDR